MPQVFVYIIHDMPHLPKSHYSGPEPNWGVIQRKGGARSPSRKRTSPPRARRQVPVMNWGQIGTLVDDHKRRVALERSLYEAQARIGSRLTKKRTLGRTIRKKASRVGRALGIRRRNKLTRIRDRLRSRGARPRSRGGTRRRR